MQNAIESQDTIFLIKLMKLEQIFKYIYIYIYIYDPSRLHEVSERTRTSGGGGASDGGRRLFLSLGEAQW